MVRISGLLLIGGRSWFRRGSLWWCASWLRAVAWLAALGYRPTMFATLSRAGLAAVESGPLYVLLTWIDSEFLSHPIS